MPKIIALTGSAGSGKDTFANAIKTQKENVEIFAIVKPLKDACKILFNFTDEQLYDPILKETVDERWHQTPREILQWLGTNVLRTFIHEYFFLFGLKQRIDASKADIIVISDTRFDNEAQFIKLLGGKVVKIDRIGGPTSKHSSHSSEQGISQELIDLTIINDDTIEKFESTVDLVLEGLFGKEGKAIKQD